MTISKPQIFKLFFSAAIVSLMLAPASAEALETLVKGAPANVNPIRAPRAQATLESPLTVKSVIVDQTAENAVAARAAALKAAPRLAFQKLVEQNMTPAEAAAFKYPDDKTIAAMVQDFEVKNEQLSSTRYVASYNVRFGEAVRRYVTIREVPVAAATSGVPVTTVTTTTTTQTLPNMLPEDAALMADTGIINAPAPSAALSPVDEMIRQTAASAPQRQRQLLVLPYYENMAGKTLLWEEGNPWRQMWQRSESMADTAATNFIVPLGDIGDVAAGSSNAVWSGDYQVVEKLRKIYAADEVILSVVNKSGPYVTVDMYFFKNGKLEARQVLQPYVGEKDEAEALELALQTVIAYLQNPPVPAEDKKDMLVSISRELTAGSAAATVAAAQPGTTVQTPTITPAPMPAAMGPTDISGHMGFTQFSVWSDFQRRLTTVVPPVILELRSISGDGADFTLKSGSNLQTVQAALQQKGIILHPPQPGAQTYGVTLAK